MAIFSFFRYGNDETNEYSPRLILLLAIIIPVMLAFSSVNFFMHRYMLLLVPCFCLLAGAALDSLHMRFWIKSVLLLVMLIMCAVKISVNMFDYDNSMGYVHFLHLQKEATQYMEDNHLENRKIEASYPIYRGLTDKRTGFISGNDFTNITFGPDEAEYVCLFTTYDLTNYLPKAHRIELLKSFKENGLEIGVYKVMPN